MGKNVGPFKMPLVAANEKNIKFISKKLKDFGLIK
jgi:hypothetical protein